MNLFVSKTSSWLGLAFPFLLMNFSSQMSLSHVKRQRMRSLIQQNIGRKFWGRLLVPQKNSFSFIDFRIRAGCSMNGWKAKAWKRPSTRIKTCAMCLTTGKILEAKNWRALSCKEAGEGIGLVESPISIRGSAYIHSGPPTLMTRKRHRSLRTPRLPSKNVWWRVKR